MSDTEMQKAVELLPTIADTVTKSGTKLSQICLIDDGFRILVNVDYPMPNNTYSTTVSYEISKLNYSQKYWIVTVLTYELNGKDNMLRTTIMLCPKESDEAV